MAILSGVDLLLPVDAVNCVDTLKVDVADGMLYLSFTGFVHCDLATRNVFVGNGTVVFSPHQQG
jgi:hypothetical protein